MFNGGTGVNKVGMGGNQAVGGISQERDDYYWMEPRMYHTSFSDIILCTSYGFVSRIDDTRLLAGDPGHDGQDYFRQWWHLARIPPCERCPLQSSKGKSDKHTVIY